MSDDSRSHDANEPDANPESRAGPPREARALRVRCPHCHNPIEVVADDPLTDIECPSCGSHFSLISGQSTAPRTPSGRQKIGRFTLLERVGTGRFGSVWKAHDDELDRTVAVKIPRQGHLDSAEVEAFLREARSAAQVRHPNIVSVYEIGREADSAYIVSDFIVGANLREWLSGQRLTFREAAVLCAKVADALHEAHEAGVVHRDLKPSNIMLDASGEPHITDFGLAKRDSGEITMTLDGQLLGTPAYMSPEQARGQAHQADRRADIYSLGVILYELLTGEVPFRGETAMLVVQILRDEPPRPRKYNSRIPRDLETICLKCLEKDPVRRYPTARALANELRRYLRGEPIRARPISRVARGWRWCRRNPAIASLVGLTLALLLLVAVVATAGYVRTSQALGVTKVAQSRTERALAAESEARRNAEAATRRAREAQAQIEKEKRQTEAALYLGRIALAHRDWLANDIARAETGLYACPSQLRRWEWYYLKHLCHLDVLTLRDLEPVSIGCCVVFSPDGKRIATGARKVTIWDSTTGMALVRPTFTGSTVRCIAFSPDGKLLAGATDHQPLGRNDPLVMSYAVKIWDATTGQELRSLQTQDWATWTVAFSPDGKHVLSGASGVCTKRGITRLPSSEKPIIVWEVATGRKVLTCGQNTGSAHSVAFCPSGKRIVVGSDWTGAVRVWDAITGQELLSLQGHESGVVSVAYSPDGRWIASGSRDRTVRLWEAITGKQAHVLRGFGDAAWSVAFSPDGKRLAVGSWDNSVRLWDVATGKELFVLRGHARPVYGVAFSPDGKRIASAGWFESVKLWDATHPPDFVHVQEYKPRYRHDLSEAFAFSPDGRRIAASGPDRTVKIRSSETGGEILTLRGHKGDVTALAFSSEGRHIASGSEDKTIRLWDAMTGREIYTLEGHGQGITAIAFDRHAERLISASDDETVRIWDVLTGNEVRVLRGLVSKGKCVAFSPDASRMFSTSGDGRSARVWEIAAGRELTTLRSLTQSVRGAAFNGTGSQVVAGCWQVAEVWDVATGSKLPTLGGHHFQVTAVAFSPDNTRILTAGEDDILRLWIAATGEQVLTWRQEDRIVAALFDPTGRRVAIRLWNGTTKIYDAPSATPADSGPRSTTPGQQVPRKPVQGP